MILRVLVMFLSAGGVASAVVLWLMGRGHLAARILVADVLVILVTLLLL